MKDIIGRELHVNDLVLTYPSSWTRGATLETALYAVIIGDCKAYMRYMGVVSIDVAYLVESPTAEELEIKREIIDNYHNWVLKRAKKDEERRNRKKIVTAKGAFSVGDILVPRKNDNRYHAPYYIYLGERNICGDNQSIGRDKGYVYLNLYAKIEMLTGPVRNFYDAFLKRVIDYTKDGTKICMKDLWEWFERDVYEQAVANCSSDCGFDYNNGMVFQHVYPLRHTIVSTELPNTPVDIIDCKNYWDLNDFIIVLAKPTPNLSDKVGHINIVDEGFTFAFLENKGNKFDIQNINVTYLRFE